MKGKQLTRQGKKLQKLPDGAPRRLADGRNAWRMMSKAQRVEFVKFMAEQLGYTPKVEKEHAAEVCHQLALCDAHDDGGCRIPGLTASGTTFVRKWR